MSEFGNLPPGEPRQGPTADDGSAPPPPARPCSASPKAPFDGRKGISPQPTPLPPASQVEVWTPAWPRRVRRLLLVTTVLLPLMFLASWSYAEPSRGMCGGCHTVEAAALASANSVHAEVPCLSCHHREGFLGAVTYYPTLVRETIHEVSGLPVATGVLQPKDCESCHAAVADSDGHQGLGGLCLDCHGEVVHPGIGDQPQVGSHEEGYYLTHGRDVVSKGDSCSDCHATDFCGACHVQASFPHPDAWISQHGSLSMEQGSVSCDSCHPTSFCGGCHGTEIPHQDNWLGLHYRSDFSSISACVTCHEQPECSSCHVRHGLHRQQSLYYFEATSP